MKRENSNNWTKILTEKDLPKHSAEYFVVIKGTLEMAYYTGINRWLVPGNDFPKTTEIHGITHFQEILIPELPFFS